MENEEGDGGKGDKAFCHWVLVMRQGKIVEEGITGWGILMADFLVTRFRECKKDHIDEGIWSFFACSSWLLCHRSCFLQIRER